MKIGIELYTASFGGQGKRVHFKFLQASGNRFLEPVRVKIFNTISFRRYLVKKFHYPIFDGNLIKEFCNRNSKKYQMSIK